MYNIQIVLTLLFSILLSLWPIIYIFYKKGKRKIIFVVSYYLFVCIAYILIFLILLPISILLITTDASVILRSEDHGIYIRQLIYSYKNLFNTKSMWNILLIITLLFLMPIIQYKRYIKFWENHKE